VIRLISLIAVFTVDTHPSVGDGEQKNIRTDSVIQLKDPRPLPRFPKISENPTTKNSVYKTLSYGIVVHISLSVFTPHQLHSMSFQLLHQIAMKWSRGRT